MESETLTREIQHIRELMDQHNAMTQLAINKAETTMNERLASLNEFRSQQADTIARFATMERLNSAIDAFNIRIDQLNKEQDAFREWKSNMEGKSTIINILWPMVVGVATFILSHYYR